MLYWSVHVAYAEQVVEVFCIIVPFLYNIFSPFEQRNIPEEPNLLPLEVTAMICASWLKDTGQSEENETNS